MKLKIIDKLNNQLNIHEYNPKMSIDQIKIELNELRRYASSSVSINTTGAIQPREIKMKIDIDAEQDNEFIQKINLLYNFFRFELSPYYLIDEETNRKTEIFLKSFNDSYKEGAYRRLALDTELVFSMVDGVWKDISETIINTTLTNSVSVFVTLSDNEADTYPVFEITNTSLSALDDFYLICKNQFTTYVMRIQAQELIPSKKIIIDNSKGEIRVDNSIINKKMTAGSFFKFVKGTNEINFLSSNLGSFTTKIIYEKRYYF